MTTGPRAPSETGRLFAHYAGGVPIDECYRPFLIARLLEEGETADLRWLTSSVSQPALREWLVQRGSRQLSCRSQSFWRLLLILESGSATVPVTESPLWQR